LEQNLRRRSERNLGTVRQRSRLESMARLFALAVAGSLAALALPRTAKASEIPVTHASDVITRARDPPYPGSTSRSYDTYNLQVNGHDPTGLALVLFYRIDPVEGNVFIGGLQNNPSDPDLPQSYASGFINKEDDLFYGLNYGDVLGGNVPGGAWGFADELGNRDGDIGTWDTTAQVFLPDAGEMYTNTAFTGVSPFPEVGVGTIGSVNIPEPATGALLVAGLIAAAAGRKARGFHNRIFRKG
jgi:hypothetical protein